MWGQILQSNIFFRLLNLCVIARPDPDFFFDPEFFVITTFLERYYWYVLPENFSQPSI